ncbi:uncharacterized protein LOC143465611 isoform X4 [Clavelina lepadiformis]|uniref:uncharacterized protein LOC143465611 isoform X4 n=1 Tax=Clavelina lepadiformis TaxID=159417 RepID=UPI004042AD00
MSMKTRNKKQKAQTPQAQRKLKKNRSQITKSLKRVVCASFPARDARLGNGCFVAPGCNFDPIFFVTYAEERSVVEENAAKSHHFNAESVGEYSTNYPLKDN